MIWHPNISSENIKLNMLFNIERGRWAPNIGIRMIIEKIWQLLKELDMEEIYPDVRQVAHIYMYERVVFDKTVKLWTTEMMKQELSR